MADKWYDSLGPSGEIAVSSRVRLARNLREFPFPSRMNSDQAAAVVDRIESAITSSNLGKDFGIIRLTPDNRELAASLTERHLISPEFATHDGVHAVMLSKDESVSIMINEEDHLRIQVLGAGLSLDNCLRRALEVDAVLDGAVQYAFDEQLGYLTQCPTNLGTGLRGSVMLHLPALTQTNAIRQLIAAAGKLGFAVRGLYGEGSVAVGDFFQISNQLTLGFTESELVSRISDSVTQLIAQENAARLKLLEIAPNQLADRVWRSYGLLSSARVISSGEATALLSVLRLGVAMGLIKLFSTPELDRLIRDIQPASLQQQAGEQLEQPSRDVTRAEYIRTALSSKI